MSRKIPKPRRGDGVETLGLERMFGRVVGFESPTKVRVKWYDKDKPYVRVERIDNLALVSRKKQVRKLRKVF